MIDEYYLYTFESTHGAISTEKLFKQLGCIVMPVPRIISTSCGIAVRVSPDSLEESIKLFKDKSTLEEGEYLVYHIRHDKGSDTLEAKEFPLVK